MIIIILFMVVMGLIFLFSGKNREADPIEKVSPAGTSSTGSAQISAEKNKILELETKIETMQRQINELQTSINSGLTKHRASAGFGSIHYQSHIKRVMPQSSALGR